MNMRSELLEDRKALEAAAKYLRRVQVTRMAEDFGFYGFVAVAHWLTPTVPANVFQTMLTSCVRFLTFGMAASVAIRLILSTVLSKRVRLHEDVLRPKSGSVAVDVSMWLLDPHNTASIFGFTVLLSAIAAWLRGPELLPTSFSLPVFVLYVASIVIFAAVRLRGETINRKLTHHALLGSSQRVEQRVCWFAVVCLISVAILWMGARFNG